MSFSLSCFSEIIAKYNTWEALRDFVVSEEGGSLRVIDSPERTTAIIRYTKEKSDFTKNHVGAFRSVVWNKVTNRPVSVAPVKAMEDGLSNVNVHVSDFVDGTMIQAWKESGNIQIASRSSIGAETKFYSERSFSQLFNDALINSGGAVKFLDSVLENNTFVSFILQHREHKIVAPVAYNRIFVTHYGKIDESGLVSMYFLPEHMPERLASYVPHVHENTTFVTDEKSAIDGMRHLQNSYTWQGLVFQDLNSSRRWRFRNPAYMVVRSLRGSEANPLERFLRLRASGKVKQYLGYFREEGPAMWEFEQTLRSITEDLYNSYNDMNKFKTKGMRDLLYSLRPHVYALHGVYLKRINDPLVSVKSMLKDDVVKYVNSLAVAEQVKLFKRL